MTKLPKSFTTVTRLPRTLALIMLIVLPIVVNISGHKAMVFTNANGFDDYYVYLDDNKYLLLISVSKQVGEKEIADQILSTFKFTN
jgi:hypothetical protein